jgi:hypothetical protein
MFLFPRLFAPVDKSAFKELPLNLVGEFYGRDANDYRQGHKDRRQKVGRPNNAVQQLIMDTLADR